MGIYEQDIRYFGGSVEYTGKIFIRSRRSAVEEAIIHFENQIYSVTMEHFRDGSAVIIDFLQDGQACRYTESMQAQRFLNAFERRKAQDLRFLSYELSRYMKQFGTLLMQLFCIVCFLYGFYKMVTVGPYIMVLALMGLAIILFFLLGSFYSYYRCKDINDHNPKIFHNDDN